MTRPPRAGLVFAAACAVLVAACSATSTTSSTTTVPGSPAGSSPVSMPGTVSAASGYSVFNGQGNNLDAYQPKPPFTSQRVIKTVADSPDGLDINAQICFFPDGSDRFVAGEDTGQTSGDRQGWGIFQLQGDQVGSFAATQKAKLVPTYQGAKDNAENYGCGFLSDGRIVTTDVGNQALGPADGQLIVWFPPFDSETIAYCKLDVTIATAQSIVVDENDNVYVASARPAPEPDATQSGVYKYAPPFPTSNTAAGGCGKTDGTGSPMADSVNRTKVLGAGENGVLSPSGIARTASGGFYLSSVASGVINEYDRDWTFVRSILQPPAGEQIGAASLSTGTPLGIGVGPDGTIFYADIGIVNDPKDGLGPGNKTGSVRRITFTDGKPNAPETMATGLEFPDGIGIFVP